MEIIVALTTDLRKEFEAEIKRAEKAVTQAVRRAGRGLKEDLRAETRRAGLGNRLPRTWTHADYPSGAGIDSMSLNAATEVWSRAPHIAQAFTSGAVIRSKQGRFLAIPTENVPRARRAGARLTPANWPEAQLGPLRFVPRGGRPPLLVAEGLRARKGKRGGFARGSARALRTGKGLQAVVMFILVPQARLRKRLDLERLAAKWNGRVADLVNEEFQKLDAAPAFDGEVRGFGATPFR